MDSPTKSELGQSNDRGSENTPRRRTRGVVRTYNELQDEFDDIEEDSDFEPPLDSPTGNVSASRKRRATPKTPTKSRGRQLPARSTTDLDKSARKRATKLLLNRTFDNDNDSDDLLEEQENLLAERIILESRLEQGQSDSPLKANIEEILSISARDSSVSLFLDGFEGYFDQHKTRERISTTQFTKAPDLEYGEFISYLKDAEQLHRPQRNMLYSIYSTMFTQWHFELTQGFSLLFYGVGSKRQLLVEFVTKTIPKESPVLVVNGYNPATTFKEVLTSVASTLIGPNHDLPRNPPDLVSAMLKELEKRPVDPLKPELVILIHNIDGEALRSDRSQAILARIASAKQIWIVASIDHIHAPVLWDAAKLSLYNFLWHDTTTFEPYSVETSFEEPLALGKSRQVVGVKGVKYVLSSLTVNAKSLYRVLVTHQIESMNEVAADESASANLLGGPQFGLEFKQFYQMCVEEFIVSNELNFRTMLTEFLEHKMAVLLRTASGMEIVYIPFTKQAIEDILIENLTG